MNFQERVLEKVESEGRTLTWLAKRVNVSRQYLHAYLHGKVNEPGVVKPELANLRERICAALDWPIE